MLPLASVVSQYFDVDFSTSFRRQIKTVKSTMKLKFLTSIQCRKSVEKRKNILTSKCLLGSLIWGLKVPITAKEVVSVISQSPSLRYCYTQFEIIRAWTTETVNKDNNLSKWRRSVIIMCEWWAGQYEQVPCILTNTII